MRALNDDADKLLAEYGPEAATSPEMARLRSEMRECNELYAALVARQAREPAPGANQDLLQYLDTVRRDLTELERDLASRMQQSMPNDLREVDALITSHRVKHQRL